MNISFAGITGFAIRNDGSLFKFDENTMIVSKKGVNKYTLTKQKPSGEVKPIEKHAPTYKQIDVKRIDSGSLTLNTGNNCSINHVEDAKIKLGENTKLKINDIGKAVKVYLSSGAIIESAKNFKDVNFDIKGSQCKITGNYLKIEA